MVTSPVMRPTSVKISENSRYFWFDKAYGQYYLELRRTLIGLV